MSDSVLAGLEFRLADLNDRTLFETLAAWYSDPEILACLTPNQREASLAPPTPGQLMAGYAGQKKLVWFIFSEGRLVGEVTLDPDFSQLMRPVANSAWVSIVIGERSDWGRGFGPAAMRFLEATSRNMGFRRIELGVFSFNRRALALYQRMGYQVCGVNPHFTYWNGIWHDDIRLEKILEPGR